MARISSHCHTTPEQLIQANPELANQRWLYVGQQITIPGGSLDGSRLQITPASGPAGTRVEVSAGGFVADSPVFISLARAGSAGGSNKIIESGPDGLIATGLAIPPSSQAGENWTITVRGQASSSSEIALSHGFAVTPQSIEYVVKRGDRLSRIASRFETTVQEILKHNPNISNPDRIFPGQKLTISGEPQPELPAIIIRPDTGSPGSEVEARLTGFSPNKLVVLVIGKYGQEDQYLDRVQIDSEGKGSLQFTIPESAQIEEEWVITGFLRARQAGAGVPSNRYVVMELPVSYQVKAGDSLGKIAARFGVPLYALLYANPEIENPRRIYPGQQLAIPDEEMLAEFVSGERIVDPGIEIRDGERWIAVNLSTQMVHAYEGEDLVRSFIVSTGTARYPTVTGKYRIYVKYRAADMRGPGYHLRDVPYVMYFYKGYGLHGTYWHSNFGTPMSHGCVNLRTEDAEWLFDFASVGTLVHVHN